jgi:hypothetical protein
VIDQDAVISTSGGGTTPRTASDQTLGSGHRGDQLRLGAARAHHQAVLRLQPERPRPGRPAVRRLGRRRGYRTTRKRRSDTDPLNPDTDGDGLGDGLERAAGLDPFSDDVSGVIQCNPFLDDDADLLNECEERVIGTDPCVADSDGDG